ncbi:MAG: FeoA domain protein [Pelotomaculum sp. PtaB.Bin013]|nr:MAG: FeoA domain protein [Pelotomaculum sp. PtaB.Bin013]
MIPLAIAPIGEKHKIQAIYGSENVRSHLESLGFTCDSEIGVVSKTYGNLIVMVKGSRVALSEDLAKKIMV